MARFKSAAHGRAAALAKADRKSFATFGTNAAVVVDFEDLAKGLRSFDLSKRNTIILRGLNVGINKVNSTYHKRLSKISGIKIKRRLKRGVNLTRAHQSRLSASNRIRDRSIRITKRYFGASYRNHFRAGGLARQKQPFSPKGVSHVAGGVRRTVKGSFMIPGKEPAFIRLKGSRKYPIVPLWGHNPAKILRNNAGWAYKTLDTIAAQSVIPEVKRQHKLEINRLKRKFGL